MPAEDLQFVDETVARLGRGDPAILGL